MKKLSRVAIVSFLSLLLVAVTFPVKAATPSVTLSVVKVFQPGEPTEAVELKAVVTDGDIAQMDGYLIGNDTQTVKLQGPVFSGTFWVFTETVPAAAPTGSISLNLKDALYKSGGQVFLINPNGHTSVYDIPSDPATLTCTDPQNNSAFIFNGGDTISYENYVWKCVNDGSGNGVWKKTTKSASQQPPSTPPANGGQTNSQQKQDSGAGTGNVKKTFIANSSQNYPDLGVPVPSQDFPNDLVNYEKPFEKADVLETGHGSLSVPQYYMRVLTAANYTVPSFNVTCQSTKDKGCLLIVINHYGDSVMLDNLTVRDGFTVAGRVFDMGDPRKVTAAAQALLNHFTYRMTASADGANCGSIDACAQLQYQVIVIGNGTVQTTWVGTYSRS